MKNLPMTRSEALDSVREARRCTERLCQIMLQMYERDAYKALGYRTVDEFTKRELGYSRANFYRLVASARTEQIISDARYEEYILSPAIDSVLFHLSRLQDPELIVQAWDSAMQSVRDTNYAGSETVFNGKITISIMKRVIDKILCPEPDEPLLSDPLPETLPKIASRPSERIPRLDGFVPATDANIRASFHRQQDEEVTVIPEMHSHPSTPARQMNLTSTACLLDYDARALIAMAVLEDGTIFNMLIPFELLPEECQPR